MTIPPHWEGRTGIWRYPCRGCGRWVYFDHDLRRNGDRVGHLHWHEEPECSQYRPLARQAGSIELEEPVEIEVLEEKSR